MSERNSGSFLNITKLLSLAISCILFFNACTKDVGIQETGVKLRFVHASPDAAAIQISLNGQAAFTPALVYRDTSSYIDFNGGTYNLSSVTGTRTVVNTVIDLVPKSQYTLIMVDSSRKTTLAVYKDKIDVAVAPLRIKIRFLNLLPNAPTLGLVGISATDTVALSPGKNFSPASAATDEIFETLPSNIYELLVISTNSIITRIPARAFVSGKFYTVFVSGFINGTNVAAPAISVIQHN